MKCGFFPFQKTPLHVIARVAYGQADYAQERLDAREEFEEELDEALHLRKMVEMGLHDRALERLMSVTEVLLRTHSRVLSRVSSGVYAPCACMGP